mmetsp:Transcript_5861/g.19655  ORF Transcript_5861/g.19655 Transcript_5861/m.19655 type:complete len:227 (-) Transcript_5861:491-1171(-)
MTLGSFLGVSSHLLAFLRVPVVCVEEGCVWFLGVASSHRFLFGFFLVAFVVESSSSHSFVTPPFLFPTDCEASSSSSSHASFCKRRRCSLTFSVSAAESSIVLATTTFSSFSSFFSFPFVVLSHRLFLFLFFSSKFGASSSVVSFFFSSTSSALIEENISLLFCSSRSRSLFLSMFLIVSSFSLANICSLMASLYPLFDSSPPFCSLSEEESFFKTPSRRSGESCL